MTLVIELAERLKEWLADPSQLEDDGIPAPTLIALNRALEICSEWSADGVSKFDRVLPTGDGGIAFAVEPDDERAMLEIEPDGNCELVRMRRGKVLARIRNPVPNDFDT